MKSVHDFSELELVVVVVIVASASCCCCCCCSRCCYGYQVAEMKSDRDSSEVVELAALRDEIDLLRPWKDKVCSSSHSSSSSSSSSSNSSNYTVCPKTLSILS